MPQVGSGSPVVPPGAVLPYVLVPAISASPHYFHSERQGEMQSLSAMRAVVNTQHCSHRRILPHVARDKDLIQLGLHCYAGRAPLHRCEASASGSPDAGAGCLPPQALGAQRALIELGAAFVSAT